jgi:uncharacterized membrane protein YdbT with pleckstrin-like domain
MDNKKIWDKTLSDNEKVEFEFSIGKRYIKTCLIIWGIISFPLLFSFGLGIITFLSALFYYGYYLKISNAYAFTNKRVLIHRGWLSTRTTSIDYQKITDVHIQEPFFDRVITHTGSIAINTAGSGGLEVILRNVESPYEIKKRLDSLKDK